MLVTIEIKSGQNKEPTKRDIQKNIDILNALNTNSTPAYIMQSLMDTISILKGIQEQLSEFRA